MIKYILTFGAGLVVGSFVAFATFCICSVAGDDEYIVKDVR